MEEACFFHASSSLSLSSDRISIYCYTLLFVSPLEISILLSLRLLQSMSLTVSNAFFLSLLLCQSNLDPQRASIPDNVGALRFPLLAASEKLHIEIPHQTRKYQTELNLGKAGPELISVKVATKTGEIRTSSQDSFAGPQQTAEMRLCCHP